MRPDVLDSYVKSDASRAGLMDISDPRGVSKERTLTGAMDLQTDFTLADWLAAKLKFGGMYQHRTRNYDYNSASGNQGYSGGGAVVTAIQQAFPGLIMFGGRISYLNFIDEGYDYGEFLNGDYHLEYPTDINLMWDMLPVAKRVSSLEGYQVNKLGSVINDYYSDSRQERRLRDDFVQDLRLPLRRSGCQVSESRDGIQGDEGDAGPRRPAGR